MEGAIDVLATRPDHTGKGALGERDPLLAPNPWYEQWAVEPARREAQEFVCGADPREGVIQATMGRSRSRRFVVGCTGASPPSPRFSIKLETV